jgi:hypothetical protein
LRLTFYEISDPNIVKDSPDELDLMVTTSVAESDAPIVIYVDDWAGASD